MFLAIRGKVTSGSGDNPVWRAGKVDFGGLAQEISRVFHCFKEMGELTELKGRDS